MGQLFDRITEYENLRQAAWAGFKGKRGRASANALFMDLEGQLLQLQADLRSGRYQPGPYRAFTIVDPKPRLISAAPLIDRVVHHAVVRVLEPRFERRFIHHSYACRTGKGQHRALAQFRDWARRFRYVLVLDVHKFFPSIDHEVLAGVLFRTVRDPAVRDLIRRILAGSNPQVPVPCHYPGDDLLAPLERRRGLPIGNLTSQFFANALLDVVDHHVKDRLRVQAYLRYADDLALFGDDKAALWAARASVEAQLHGLRLRLNRGESRVRRPAEGVTFLGFTVRPGSARLGPVAVRRARRRHRALRVAFWDGAAWLEVRSSLAA
jgi:retron-type reverse transcriptase